MIDGDRQKPPSGASGPFGRHMQKRQRIPPAGQGQGERMVDIPVQPRIQPGRDPAFRRPAQRQDARVRVSAAMARNAGVEVAS